MLESWCALSDSLVWKILQNFYISMGVDSWSKNIIPNRLTTNAYIAGQYAQMIAEHMQDLPILPVSDHEKQPVFTIIELGAGHGKLGFLLLQHLDMIAQTPNIKLPKFRYVMTDLAERNIQFWQDNKQLKPFAKSGLLDFAVFKAGTDQQITLINSGEVISTRNKADHIIAIGNYFFDSLPLDYFKITDGGLYECQSAIAIKEGKSVTNVMDPDTNDKLELRWQEKEISLPHYDNSVVDNILSTYAAMQGNFYFNIPVCAYKMLSSLKAMCRHEIIVISADKGFASLEQMRSWYRKPPSLYCQGSYSFMVNFHALGQWFENNGGFYEVTSQRKGLLELAVYCSDGPREKYKALYRNFITSIEPFSPTDFYTLVSNEQSRKSPHSLTKLLSIIRFSKYDPDIFYRYRNVIRKQINGAHKDDIRDLKLALPKILKMHYHLGSRDIPFVIGRIYHRLKMYKEAIENYKISLSRFGENHINYYNIGLCFYRIELYEQALKAFKQSLKMTQNAVDTQEWIGKTRRKIPLHLE